MELSEVKTLSDKELRIKAAELAGWTEIIMEEEVYPVGVPPCWKGWLPPGETTKCDLPDFNNDTAAAMELIETARKNDFWWSASFKTDAGRRPTDNPFYEVRFRCVRGGTRGDYAANALTLPRAITHAFVLAMTQETG